MCIFIISFFFFKLLSCVSKRVCFVKTSSDLHGTLFFRVTQFEKCYTSIQWLLVCDVFYCTRQVKLSVILLDPLQNHAVCKCSLYAAEFQNTKRKTYLKSKPLATIHPPYSLAKKLIFCWLAAATTVGVFRRTHRIVAGTFFAFVLPENRRYFYDHCYYCFFVRRVRRRRRKNKEKYRHGDVIQSIIYPQRACPGVGSAIAGRECPM